MTDLDAEAVGWKNDDPDDKQNPESWRDRPLPGMPMFPGLPQVRMMFQDAFGVEWTASYIDPSKWNESLRMILPRHRFAADKILERARGLLKEMDVRVFQPPHRSGAR